MKLLRYFVLKRRRKNRESEKLEKTATQINEIERECIIADRDKCKIIVI